MSPTKEPRHIPLFLGSVLLEKNRWLDTHAPTLLVSEWICRARSCGFDGIELWQYHWTLASETERSRLCESAFVKVFNSYAKLDTESAFDRTLSTEAASALGAQAVKFNFGPSWNTLDGELDAVRRWAEQLGPGIRLLCECHAGTAAETPAGAAQIAESLKDSNVGYIAHAFADSAESMERWVEALGPKLAHIHIQSRDRAGRWRKLSEQIEEVRQRCNTLKSSGFHGTFTIEFTAGVNTPDESPERLYATACEDLKLLRELLSES